MKYNQWKFDGNRINSPYSGGSIVWSDQGDLFFFADLPESRQTEERKNEKGTGVLYRLNINSGKREIFEEKPGRGPVCYRNGWLYYAKKDVWSGSNNGVEIVKYTKKNIYDRQTKDITWEFSKAKRLKMAPLSCKLTEKPKEVDENKAWNPLKTHLYLISEIGMRNREHLYTLINKDEENRKLPINSNEFYATRKQWAEWENMFFFPKTMKRPEERIDWKESGCLQGYWLALDGRVKEECFPAGVWSNHNVPHVKVYKHGLVFSVKAKDPNLEGIYITKDGSSRRIESGYTREPFISPDGCSVAFGRVKDANRRTVGEGGMIQLVIANLCD